MMPTNTDPPEAEVVLLPRRRLWKVLRCPYCGKAHYHGAGERKSDPRKFLGHRVAHCMDISLKGYVLVERSPGA